MHPSQLPKRGFGSRHDGSRRLLAAILERALKDARDPTLEGGATCRPAEREGVIAWFGAAEAGPGTFRWLCTLLELDADNVLVALGLGNVH